MELPRLASNTAKTTKATCHTTEKIHAVSEVFTGLDRGLGRRTFCLHVLTERCWNKAHFYWTAVTMRILLAWLDSACEQYIKSQCTITTTSSCSFLASPNTANDHPRFSLLPSIPLCTTSTGCSRLCLLVLLLLVAFLWLLLCPGLLESWNVRIISVLLISEHGIGRPSLWELCSLANMQGSGRTWRRP